MTLKPNKHPVYRAWANMKTRCYNKNSPDYPSWGGRGIKVCPRWQTSANFMADMLTGHFAGATLERLDNDADYSPENCIWADRKTPANNKRNTRLIEFKGEKLTISGWAKKTGVNYSTLAMRHYAYGWPVEKLLRELNQ